MNMKQAGLGLALWLGVACAGVAHGALIVQEPVPGQKVVIDTETNLMWCQNSNPLGANGVNWWSAFTWVDNFTWANFDDWRLPHGDPTITSYAPASNTEMGRLRQIYGIDSANPGPFTPPSTIGYWTDAERNSEYAYRYYFNAEYPPGGQNYYWKTVGSKVWPVRTVPEPATLLLLTAGGTLLYRRRR